MTLTELTVKNAELKFKRIELKIEIMREICAIPSIEWVFISSETLDLAESVMALLEKQEIVNHLKEEVENDIQ